MNDKKDNPGVVAPPPAIYLAALLAGLLLNHFFPLSIFFVPRLAALIIGVALIAVAGIVIIAALQTLARHKTNVEPWKPTTALVTTGVYAVSRNPIYLAMTMLYAGAALLLNSFWILLLLAPVLLLINFGVIVREENYLSGKFADEYAAYKKRVRRWI